MRRLIRLLFAVSDLLAWSVVIFCALVVVAFPVIAPEAARMEGVEVSILWIVLVCSVAILVGISAFALTRRKPWGLFGLLLPCVTLLVGSVQAVVVYGAMVLAVFGLPLFLTYVDLRRNLRSGGDGLPS